VVKPVIELVKLPVPVPLSVLLLSMVGDWFVLQQMPLAVTGEPPSFAILPPPVAVVSVVGFTANVFTVGGVARVMALF